MEIKQDVVVGSLFFMAGLAGLLAGASLGVGRLVEIGPGFAPHVVSIGLMGIGVLIVFRGRKNSPRLELPHLRPILTVTGGLLIFALLIKPMGLVITVTATTVFLSALGGAWRPVESLVVGVLFSLALAAIFIFGLKLPITMFWF